MTVGPQGLRDAESYTRHEAGSNVIACFEVPLSPLGGESAPAQEAATRVATMATLDVRSRSLKRPLAIRIPLNHVA
jgi:hypothetical protein